MNEHANDEEILNELLKPEGESIYDKPKQKIKSMYESWEPEDLPEEYRGNYEIEFSGHYGGDSGRRRFKVKCLRCEQIVHENTTSPNCVIKDHEKAFTPELRCKKLDVINRQIDEPWRISKE